MSPMLLSSMTVVCYCKLSSSSLLQCSWFSLLEKEKGTQTILYFFLWLLLINWNFEKLKNASQNDERQQGGSIIIEIDPPGKQRKIDSPELLEEIKWSKHFDRSKRLKPIGQQLLLPPLHTVYITLTFLPMSISPKIKYLLTILFSWTRYATDANILGLILATYLTTAPTMWVHLTLNSSASEPVIWLLN